MITNEVNVFTKHENTKHAWEKCEKSAHHGVRTAVWPNAIQHSKSVEWHSSCAKWHVAPLSNIHAILCDFVFSDIFFKDQLTFKKILFFLLDQTKAF